MIAMNTVDPAEIARFTAMADTWWDPTGPFKPLHQLNPIRLTFIRDQVAAHFGRDPRTAKPLSGLSVLDIGCGGGLTAEPLVRLGANVTAIDAGEENVKIASLHAEQSGLAVDYRHASAEELVERGESFDMVLALEVVEHVADLPAFMASVAALMKPGGAAVIATLNRTPQSFLLGIIGAEYLLGWLPRGTHEWRKFVRPSELARLLRGHGVSINVLRGVTYHPLADAWRLSRDLGVNYMAFAKSD